MLKNDRLASVVFVIIFIIVKEKKKTKKIKNEEELEERPPRQRPRVVVSVLVRVLLFIFVFFSVIIYILKKVCRKYAEGMQCITLTLSTYLVLQQLSLFQTARPYFTKCIKTLNIFVATFFSPDIFGLSPSFFFVVCLLETNQIFSRINNLTIQTRTT